MHADYVNRCKIIFGAPVYGIDLRLSCHIPMPLAVDPPS